MSKQSSLFNEKANKIQYSPIKTQTVWRKYTNLFFSMNFYGISYFCLIWIQIKNNSTFERGNKSLTFSKGTCTNNNLLPNVFSLSASSFFKSYCSIDSHVILLYHRQNHLIFNFTYLYIYIYLRKFYIYKIKYP